MPNFRPSAGLKQPLTTTLKKRKIPDVRRILQDKDNVNVN